MVKTKKFKDAVYVGDPVNAMRIFSDKEADEIAVLDIDASRLGQEINYELVAEMAGEAFMPMAYGGGIRTLDQVRRLIRSGIEKVVINSATVDSTAVISAASEVYGRQAVVGAVDVKRTLLGNYRVVTKSATVEAKISLEDHVRSLAAAGAGEIFINSVDRDGMMAGYDLELIRRVVDLVDVPVVACGGAGTIEHLKEGVEQGRAAAVSAGSMFVFHGRRRAVLINYPTDASV